MRQTKNRQLMIEILKNGGAFTAQGLHKRLPDIDLATIYRNLNLFTEESIVKEIRISKGESMYEMIDDGHEHAMCNKCGKIIHVNIDKTKIINSLQISDFKIEDIEVNIKGHCLD